MAIASELTLPVPRISLGDVVYERLLEAVLSGGFAAGDELNEVALAAQFQVSRTPVREALQRLAAEGLVKNSRNRQATVVRLSRAEIIQIYQVREFLESGAARLAAELITPRQLTELQTCSLRATPTATEEWCDAEREYDAALHDTVASSCGNQHLQEEIERYRKRVQLVRRLIARKPDRLALGHAEHDQIVAALAARDTQLAQAAMAKHIATSLEFVLEDLPLN